MILSATVNDIAAIVKGEILGPDHLALTGFVMLDQAGEGDLTFLGSVQHARDWAQSNATAALVNRDLDLGEWNQTSRAVIRVDNADHALVAVLNSFAEEPILPQEGIHSTALIDPTAKLGGNARIGPNVVIGPNCVIGDNAVLEAGVRLHHNVQLGSNAHLHTGVVIREHCILGDRVILHANVVIGADGFGYLPAPDGSGLVKIPHLGNVRIENDVEIGANSCVDRGKLGSTLIGMGTKIDNLCQIGHNCQIGRCCAISGLSGLAGSTTVGDGTLIGGGCGIADHLNIGRGVRLAARSGVITDVPDGATWGGFPAKDLKSVFKEHLMLQRLPALSRALKSLEENS